MVSGAALLATEIDYEISRGMNQAMAPEVALVHTVSVPASQTSADSRQHWYAK